MEVRTTPRIKTSDAEYARHVREIKAHAKEIGVYEEIERIVADLAEQEAKRALIKAIHVMENTLECDSCPQSAFCTNGIAECERNILNELLAE